MQTKLSLLAFLLFVFYTTLVEAGHLERRAPSSPDQLNTNAKRFAAGLPPLPPLRKRSTPADSARRSTPSLTLQHCEVEVRDLHNKNLGYLSKDLTNGHFTLQKKERNAETFSTYIHLHGKTDNINLIDSNKPGYYLAGIIEPGVTLDSHSHAVATIGESFPTRAGEGPQSSTMPTVPGESETAIWTSSSKGRLSAHWVNGGHSSPVTAYMFYDKSHDTFYLSGSKTLPSFSRVAFYLDCS